MGRDLPGDQAFPLAKGDRAVDQAWRDERECRLGEGRVGERAQPQEHEVVGLGEDVLGIWPRGSRLRADVPVLALLPPSREPITYQQVGQTTVVPPPFGEPSSDTWAGEALSSGSFGCVRGTAKCQSGMLNMDSRHLARLNARNQGGGVSGTSLGSGGRRPRRRR